MIYDMNQQNCPLENLFKQTRYQRQIYYTWYLRKGFVPGNNPNVNYIRGETEDYLERMEEIRAARAMRAELDNEGFDDDEAVAESDPVEVEVDDSDSDEEFDETSQQAAETVAGDLLSIYNDSIQKKLILPGGLVGNPDFNTATGVELIPGVPSKHVFDDEMDMDFASEYPWAKFTRSLSKSTQIGRLIIPEKISDRQNVLPMGQEKRIEEINSYLPGAEFTADYLSHDIISFGNVWFNLPTVTEMNKKLQERLNSKEKEDEE